MQEDKRLTCNLFLLAVSFISLCANAWVEPNWSQKTEVPLGVNRQDLYQFGPDLPEIRNEGLKNALVWPINITGLLIPIEPVRNVLEADSSHPFRRWISKITGKKVGFNSVEGMYQWLGLQPFPKEEEPTIQKIPYPDGYKPNYYMGATLMKTRDGVGLTYSCAACHFGQFLGKRIVGLTNKRPRANHYFHLGKKYLPMMPASIFKAMSGASSGETRMYKRSQVNLRSVGAILPQVLGLDTSLSHVALSLSRRKLDKYASKSRFFERFPRPNPISKMVSDSKPMPWCNLKYKNRWLSDGSIVAGNPVLTNFLWNEIGRGTDLKELEDWMKKNPKVIRELTAAVFSIKAPIWTDFFPANSISINKAKAGEKVFNRSCKECHGTYTKAWSLENAKNLTLKEQLKTTKVTYFKDTPVKDIGTDPNRYRSTKYFAARLNNLSISKWMKTLIIPQKGYVPPPLEGIFLRYPYLHNNSIPNLCALMLKPSQRPKFFIQGPSLSLRDFDQNCVGYPVGDKIPKDWYKEKDAHFDTTKPGLLNIGHTKAFYDKNGKSKMSNLEKRNLLEYLKTL